MNFTGQLLHSTYGYSDGDATFAVGLAQGGSVVGLLVIGNMLYKGLSPHKQIMLVFMELVVCMIVPFMLAKPELFPFDITLVAVWLLVLWGCAYALPFYLPPGEFALKVGGKTAGALFTNLFDAGGFSFCIFWNRWASTASKGGDFTQVLISMSAFAAISTICMPLCMYRQAIMTEQSKKRS